MCIHPTLPPWALYDPKSILMLSTAGFGGAGSVMLSPLEIDTSRQVQIPKEAAGILHITNALGKGMNPIIFSPVMGK